MSSAAALSGFLAIGALGPRGGPLGIRPWHPYRVQSRGTAPRHRTSSTLSNLPSCVSCQVFHRIGAELQPYGVQNEPQWISGDEGLQVRLVSCATFVDYRPVQHRKWTTCCRCPALSKLYAEFTQEAICLSNPRPPLLVFYRAEPLHSLGESVRVCMAAERPVPILDCRPKTKLLQLFSELGRKTLQAIGHHTCWMSRTGFGEHFAQTILLRL